MNRPRVRLSDGASFGRVGPVRLAYLTAATASVLMLCLHVWGGAPHQILRLIGSAETPAPSVMRILVILCALRFTVMTGLMLFLWARPYWWGKLVCAAAAVFWIGFAIALAVLAGANTLAFGVGVAGMAMLAAAVIHQISDVGLAAAYARRGSATP